MKDPSLEILTAYVDGELDDTRRREVEDAIRRDSAMRATVDRLRASRVTLHDAFAEIIDAPVPARLLETLKPFKTEPQPTDVIPLRRPERPRQNWQPLALAASLSLTVGLLVGFILADGERASPPETTASLVHRGLETLQTGNSLISADGRVTITPLSSFRVRDGRVCREFEQQAAEARSTGIACRDPLASQWQTQIELTTARSLSSGTSEDVYTPASGALDPLDWAFDQLGAKPAFDAADEARLIDKRWRY